MDVEVLDSKLADVDIGIDEESSLKETGVFKIMDSEVGDSKLDDVTSGAESGEEGSLQETEVSNEGIVLNEAIKFGTFDWDAPVSEEVIEEIVKALEINSEGEKDAVIGEVIKAPEVNFEGEKDAVNGVIKAPEVNSLKDAVDEEMVKAPEVESRKDAVDEWPAPKQIHSFYVVKYRSYTDLKLKDNFDQEQKELRKKNQARSQMIEKLREKRAIKAQIRSRKVPLSVESKQFRMSMDEKRKVMEPLQEKLVQLRGGRERGSVLYSSEEELNAHIKSLEYRIQHESNSLNEEKQILREIKQLEGTREKVISNAAERAKLLETVGDKESLQDQVKLIGVDLDGVRKEQQVVKAKLKQLDEEQADIEKEIQSLEDELTAMTQSRDKTFENIQQLLKLREEGNFPFYQNRTMLVKARELAAKKDIKELRNLCDSEAEKFMSLWSDSKEFRDDYEKRILSSLDMRLLSKDGRMRNPDEKPIVIRDTPARVVAEPVEKTNIIQPKEDAVPALEKDDTESTQKVEKEENNKQRKEANSKEKESFLERTDVVEDGGETFWLPKDLPPPKNEVDEAKLKEMRREEEKEKNRQALERKKKKAEKAALRKEMKAKKEAEEKLKEREKKEKKKAGVSDVARDAQEPTETEKSDEKVAEPEKIEEKVEAPVVPINKNRKQSVVRNRTRQKGLDPLPKAILKRKKATNYWLWAAAAAVLVLLLLLGYNYVM